MTWIGPIGVGVVQGLLFFWPVAALTIALRLFRFPDISIEGSFLLGACVFATGAEHGLSPLLAIIWAVCIAACVGAMTATAHAALGINKFLAGILLTAACYSLALRIAGASNIGLLSYVTPFDRLRDWNASSLGTSFDFASFGFLLLIVMSAALVFSRILSSRMGLRLRVGAVGGLPAVNLHVSHAPRLAVGLAGTAALSGLGGAMIAMRQGFFDVNMHQGVLIIALASMALGEHLAGTQRLPVVSGALISAALGSIVYQVIVALAIRIGADPVDIKLITTALVLVTLVFGRRASFRHAVKEL